MEPSDRKLEDAFPVQQFIVSGSQRPIQRSQPPIGESAFDEPTETKTLDSAQTFAQQNSQRTEASSSNQPGNRSDENESSSSQETSTPRENTENTAFREQGRGNAVNLSA